MEASYQAFVSETEDDSEDVPHESNVKIHIPPTSKVTRWSHIEDLDLFFTRIYAYHQKGGYFCILLRGVLELVKVIFMLVFCVFLVYFVDYQVLFRNKLPPNFNNSSTTPHKITIPDAICPLHQCFKDIGGFAWLCITIVLVYWLFRLIKLIYNLYHFWDIKGFFNIALQIPDDELSNITWNEVQKKICEVQREQQMCIRKNTLTELDIYHRILRSKNYMVAMVNKSVLPIKYNLPFFGEVTYMSQGLKYNYELLFFSGPWGFFENWHLKDDYKKASKRQELAARLKRYIGLFALGNTILGGFICVWQFVYFIFNYAELLKREPGVLALRCWSLNGRLFLRHFNELDHELEARLRRAYRPASKYMNTFSSPIMIIIAHYVSFIAGSVLIVLGALAIYDEDVLAVEHVLTIITILGAITAIFRGFIPDENMCWCPEKLLIEILAEVHYLPDSWRGQAHSTGVRDQFSQFFQYKAVYLVFELISPVVVPWILYFKLRPRSLEIVDFYRNFTVSVLGVGDVCSFSLMDMRKHGNPTWQAPGYMKCPENNKQTQAEDGKTELSLIHFATMNPTWQPPQEAEQFIHEVKEKARHHEDAPDEADRHSEALESVSAGLSMILSHHQPSFPTTSKMNSTSKMNFAHGCRLEGPARSSSYYYNPTFGNSDSIYGEDRLMVHAETPSVDMSINTLYLHGVHHRKLASKPREPTYEETPTVGAPSVNTYTAIIPSTSKQTTTRTNICEGTPLLKNVPKHF
ncbi:autophagy-related protein 9A [Planococcus citri]|uniref:autophagy-related protein 9A n=1 Tax=Planococcus citri TaxID=170843 RepID=UPI0031F99232